MKKQTVKVKLVAIIIMIVVTISCRDEHFAYQDDSPYSGQHSHLISSLDAIRRAEDVMGKFYGQTRAENSIKDIKLVRGRTRADSEDAMGIYIVNYDEGFAIVSADSRLPVVFAVSDEGNFSISDTIDHRPLKAFVDRMIYCNMQHLETRSILDGLEGYEIVSEGYKDICKPILNSGLTKFQQLAPYNKYCPISGQVVCPVGCTPLAIGTIMGALRWPDSINWTTSVRNTEVTRRIALDWDKMYEDLENDLWAKLFRAIGIAGKTKYEPHQSSTFVEDINPIFPKFDYEEPSRQTFTDDTLNKVMANRKLAMIGGTVVSKNASGERHTFIIDAAAQISYLIRLASDKSVSDQINSNIGSQGNLKTLTENYYRCIWGWGVKGNAYYLFNVDIKTEVKNGELETRRIYTVNANDCKFKEYEGKENKLPYEIQFNVLTHNFVPTKLKNLKQ